MARARARTRSYCLQVATHTYTHDTHDADLDDAEELSEEDQKLKDDLDMLVERLLVC